MTIRVVSGAAAAAAAAELQRGLVSVGTRAAIYKNGFEVLDTTGQTSRHRMTVQGVDRAGRLRLRYGHFGWGGATTPAGNMLLSARVEHPNNNKILQPVTFKGLQTFTLEPRGWVDSDPIGIEVEEGDYVYVRTFVRAAASTIDMPAHWSASTNRLSWKLAGNQLTAANPTAPTGYDGAGFPGNSVFMYTPTLLLAEHLDPPDAECFALIGDSNIDATGTTDSFAELAIAGDYLTARLVAAGASATAWSQPGANADPATASVDPTPFFAMVEGCTRAIIALGTNDFGTNQTDTEIVDLLDKMARTLKLYGVESVIACTMPPRTSSTTSTTPPADQVLQPDAALRASSNALLRLGTANVDWISDNASAIEVNDAGVPTIGGGKWALGTSSDGTHLRAAGNTAIQPVLRDAIDEVLAGNVGGISQA